MHCIMAFLSTIDHLKTDEKQSASCLRAVCGSVFKANCMCNCRLSTCGAKGFNLSRGSLLRRNQIRVLLS